MSDNPRLEVWSIDRIQPYEKNPRSIPEKAVKKVTGSIAEFGFQKPIVVDEHGVILAGHVVFKAAQQLGKDRVPVMISSLDATKAKAYRLADNRVSQETDWLDDLLGQELIDLSNLDYDLESLGFDERELAKLLADDAAMELAEETPEAPEQPVTVEGDVWVLNNHRIVCGDSTAAHVVEKALNGVKPHLMVTDPPYGVKYDPKWRAEAGVNQNKEKMGEVLNDDRADWTEAWVLFPGTVAYVWHAGLFAREVQNSLETAGFEVRSQIVWAKDRFALSRGHYHWQHEPCWYVVKKDAHWGGDRSQSTLWNIKSRDDNGVGHGTQKPVECMRRPIMNNSSPGQAIYEPFSGSGTTIIACEMTGRACHAIELNPAYVDVAVMRWQDFSNGTAILEGDGRTFDEIKAERLAQKEAA